MGLSRQLTFEGYGIQGAPIFLGSGCKTGCGFSTATCKSPNNQSAGHVLVSKATFQYARSLYGAQRPCAIIAINYSAQE